MKQVFVPFFALLVILTLAVVATMPSSSLEADHFHRFRDGKSLYAVLNSGVQSGDSVQKVDSLIGPGEPVTEGLSGRLSERREIAQWHPDAYPDGVFESDILIEWPIGDDSVTLQFRNGILVNHDPGFYLDYQFPHDISGRRGDSEDTLREESNSGDAQGGLQ